MSWFPFSRSSSSASSATINSNSTRMAAQIQNAAVQEPTKSSTDRETGFPEPLSPDRNTTLPHPSADTSPGATIVAPDGSSSGHRRQYSRSRSFLSRNHSHSHKASKSQEIKNGTVTTLPMPSSEGKMYEDIVYADGSRENGGSLKSGGESSGEEKRGSESAEDVLDKSDYERDETGYKPGQRKKGVLRKMKLHKV